MKLFVFFALSSVNCQSSSPPRVYRNPFLKEPIGLKQSKKREPDNVYFDIATDLSLPIGFDPEQTLNHEASFTPVNQRIRGLGQRSRTSEQQIHPNTRNIAGMLRYRLLALGVKQPDFKDLLGYGCWCTFLIKHDLRPKNMSPIDEIDEICRQWTKCHECSSIDSYYECSDQGHDEYKVRGIVATGLFSCESNESECSMKACQCDTQLVYKMSNIFETKSDIFDFTKTYKSGYNPYTQCRKARTTSDKKPDTCCGEETNRYPFYSMRGQKACCKNRTYDTGMFTCCEDGSLISLGRRCFRNPFSKS